MLLSPVVREREEREVMNTVTQGMNDGGVNNNFGFGMEKEEVTKLAKDPMRRPVGTRERTIDRVKEEEGGEMKAWERKGKVNNKCE